MLVDDTMILGLNREKKSENFTSIGPVAQRYVPLNAGSADLSNSLLGSACDSSPQGHPFKSGQVHFFGSSFHIYIQLPIF